MKKYSELEIEIILYEKDDVIRTSNPETDGQQPDGTWWY